MASIPLSVGMVEKKIVVNKVLVKNWYLKEEDKEVYFCADFRLGEKSWIFIPACKIVAWISAKKTVCLLERQGVFNSIELTSDIDSYFLTKRDHFFSLLSKFPGKIPDIYR